MLAEGKHTTPNQMPWSTRRARALALGMRAAPALHVRVRHRFHACREQWRACMAKSRSVRGARGFVPSFARANPSIERTNNGKPLFAAHVER